MIFILYNGGFSCIFAVIAFQLQLHRVTGAEEKNEIKEEGVDEWELCVEECITKDSQLDFTHSNNNKKGKRLLLLLLLILLNVHCAT